MYKKTDLESDEQLTNYHETMKSRFNTSFKLMLRRFLRLSLLWRFLILTLCIFLFVITFFQLLFSLVNILNRPNFLEYHKCPACYGFKACDAIKNGEIMADQSSNLNALFYSNQRSIFGKHVNGIKVIISKLGSQENTSDWENKICSKAKKKPDCSVNEAAKELFPNSGSKWILEAVKGQSLMTTCPTERFISAITFRYTEKLDPIDISNLERIQLVLTIWKNQEPIVYQVFSKSAEWPFPEYIGACGRVVIYENPGKPLYTFFNEPWGVRIRLALKILNIAHKFSYNPSQYGIYMMLVNPETFHYKAETRELFYTSPQNILIVDKWQLEQDNKENNGNHENIYIKNSTQCEVNINDYMKRCKYNEHWLSTVSNLCNSLYSDHNYYAVCRNIFSLTHTNGRNVGLLHNVPPNIDTLFGMTSLMERCLNPRVGDSRKDIVARMMKVLKDIIDDSDDDNSEDSYI